MNERVVALLEEGRTREKEQALFYRRLAALAGAGGREELAERFNGLHADEQHHLSRLTARILELDGVPSKMDPPEIPVPALDAWEEVARGREEAEVIWYRNALGEELDSETRTTLSEILESEEHHAIELGGKWMSA